MISSRPAIIRSVVVLPQPDGPTKTTNSLVADVEVHVLHGMDGAVVELVDLGEDDLCHRAGAPLSL